MRRDTTIIKGKLSNDWWSRGIEPLTSVIVNFAVLIHWYFPLLYIFPEPHSTRSFLIGTTTHMNFRCQTLIIKLYTHEQKADNAESHRHARAEFLKLTPELSPACISDLSRAGSLSSYTLTAKDFKLSQVYKYPNIHIDYQTRTFTIETKHPDLL